MGRTQVRAIWDRSIIGRTQVRAIWDRSINR